MPNAFRWRCCWPAPDSCITLPPVTVETYICPGCGSELKVGSVGCPKCSPPRKRRKDPRRSWDQASAYDGLDLPDEDFDHADFTAREFGQTPHRKIGIRWYWWVTAIVLLVLLMLAEWRSAG